MYVGSIFMLYWLYTQSIRNILNTLAMKNGMLRINAASMCPLLDTVVLIQSTRPRFNAIEIGSPKDDEYNALKNRDFVEYFTLIG